MSSWSENNVDMYSLCKLSYSLAECLTVEWVGSQAFQMRLNAGSEEQELTYKSRGSFNQCLVSKYFTVILPLPCVFWRTISTGGWKQAAYCSMAKQLPLTTNTACGCFATASVASLFLLKSSLPIDMPSEIPFCSNKIH